ncbi:unnamed protein product, partial [Closterium sp. Naga37s-1]
PCIEAAALGATESAALGAGESALSGTAYAAALHTFTLDSGASRCFFHDNTALTPLPAPVAVSLADPSGGPVLARSSTVLPCPAVPFGSLSGLHLRSFSMNLDSASPPTLARPSMPSLCRGAAARRSSLLLVSPDDCSPADSPHGRVGPSPGPWTGPRALLSAGCRRLHALHHGLPLAHQAGGP